MAADALAIGLHQHVCACTAGVSALFLCRSRRCQGLTQRRELTQAVGALNASNLPPATPPTPLVFHHQVLRAG